MSDPLEMVTQGNLDFSQKFSWAVAEAESGNLVYSPMSCLIALAMAHAGSKGDSVAKIARGLHLPEDFNIALPGLSKMLRLFREAEKVELSVANKIYIRENSPVAEDYSSNLRKYFDTEAENVKFTDPATPDIINKWVAEQTRDKIRDLVDANSFDSYTRLVLVNAIYFKGTWQDPFDEERTHKMPFFTDMKTSVEVSFMCNDTYAPYKKLDDLDAQLVILPYKGRQLGLAIILPNKRDGLKELEKKLARSNLSDILESARNRDVDIYLPKFKVETTLDLGTHLCKMGLDHIFSDAADFSGISPSGATNLKVSKVMQKAFIEVNEVGTEAAAATAVVMSDSMSMKRPPCLKCEHPFVFYLTFEDTYVLFGGRVTNPA